MDEKIEAQEAKRKVEENFSRLDKKFDGTIKAAEKAFNSLNEASHKFSAHSPAYRASHLGFMLLTSVLSIEVVEGFGGRIAFDFSDSISIFVLVVATVLILIGGALEVYFSIKVAEIHETRAEEALRQIQELRTEVMRTKEDATSVFKSIFRST